MAGFAGRSRASRIVQALATPAPGRDSALESLDRAKDLIASVDYGRRHPEVEDLEAELAALNSR